MQERHWPSQAYCPPRVFDMFAELLHTGDGAHNHGRHRVSAHLGGRSPRGAVLCCGPCTQGFLHGMRGGGGGGGPVLGTKASAVLHHPEVRADAPHLPHPPCHITIYIYEVKNPFHWPFRQPKDDRAAVPPPPPPVTVQGGQASGASSRAVGRPGAGTLDTGRPQRAVPGWPRPHRLHSARSTCRWSCPGGSCSSRTRLLSPPHRSLPTNCRPALPAPRPPLPLGLGAVGPGRAGS